MWRPARRRASVARLDCFACTFISEAVVTRRGSRCSLHKGWGVRVSRLQPACTAASRRALQVGARSGNRSDGRNASRRFYFGKIQIWNGWYSRLVSELRRLTPFLELVCACAPSAPPVLCELPPRRVARHPHLAHSRYTSCPNPGRSAS